MKNNKLTLTATGIGILLTYISTFSTYQYFEFQRINRIITEYSELECSKTEKKFDVDFANNEVKYFSGGLVGSGNLSKNIKKYGIENFDLGCIFYNNLDCYNEHVSNYLKTKKNITINELYK